MSGGESRVNVFRERIFPVLFMLLVTVVFISIVSGVYLATREDVLRNERLYLKRAVLFAADIELPDDPADLEARYFDNIREVERSDSDSESSIVAYYEVVSSSGAIAGYVLPAEGPGLWGEIEAVVGFDESLSGFTGVDFTKQNETPGLGGRIAENWFREQFRGKSGPLSFVPEGTDDEAKNEFDAITGATITSTAIMDILNKTQAQASGIVRGVK